MYKFKITYDTYNTSENNKETWTVITTIYIEATNTHKVVSTKIFLLKQDMDKYIKNMQNRKITTYTIE